jgi:hypothetical protein
VGSGIAISPRPLARLSLLRNTPFEKLGATAEHVKKCTFPLRQAFLQSADEHPIT